MTLFELTVVNNWFILMNAYAFTVGMYTRTYFMIFYLVTMIVLTIVVSSFLEAFRFRIHYKKSTSKRDGNYVIIFIIIISYNINNYKNLIFFEIVLKLNFFFCNYYNLIFFIESFINFL